MAMMDSEKTEERAAAPDADGGGRGRRGRRADQAAPAAAAEQRVHPHRRRDCPGGIRPPQPADGRQPPAARFDHPGTRQAGRRDDHHGAQFREPPGNRRGEDLRRLSHLQGLRGVDRHPHQRDHPRRGDIGHRLRPHKERKEQRASLHQLLRHPAAGIGLGASRRSVHREQQRQSHPALRGPGGGHHHHLWHELRP